MCIYRNDIRKSAPVRTARCLIALALSILVPGILSFTSAGNLAPVQSIVPVETLACSYQEGKNRDDLNRAIEAWNRQMDMDKQDDYYATLTTPLFLSSLSFDFGWVGGWPDTSSMGANLDYRMTTGRTLLDSFSSAITCRSHAIFQAIRLTEREPEQEATDSFVLAFENCSIAPNHKLTDFTRAYEAWIDQFHGHSELIEAAWVWLPIAGDSAESYDFKYTLRTQDYRSYARVLQLLALDNSTERQVLSKVAICDVSRVYDGTVIRD